MDWTLTPLICCVVFITFITGVASSSSPTVVNGPDNGYITAPENFPVGNELVNASFQVQDSDPGDVISVRPNNVQTAEYVRLNLTGPENNRTVHVLTIKELDRDHGVTSVSLNFVINDNQLNQIYYTIDLYITDVNDNPPIFQNEPYSWRILENSAVNSTTSTQISATDLDVGKNGQVSYRIEPDTQSISTGQEYDATFQIDQTSGEVRLVKKLDYETNNYYQFTVFAEDGGGLSSNTTFIIRVLDVQDTPPFFTGIPYRSTIDENVQGHSVVTLTARDGDTGVSNDVDYSILPGPCSSLFKVDSTGNIKTAGGIDRDTGVVYNASGVCVLQVQASEMNTSGEAQYGNTNSTTDVTVIINDENDNVPMFLQTNYTAEILENMPENVPITLVGSSELSVSDNDQGGAGYATMAITLRYPDGTDCPDFTPSPSTVSGSGTIMIRVANKNVLDYEQRHNLTLWVVATEKANTSHVATATVVLSIEDMNDNSPQFNDSRNYDFHIYENSPNGTFIGTITASDADSPRYANVTYSRAGGNDDKFHVDKLTGNITTVCATNCSVDFDREKISVYYLTYTATDAGDRSNSKAIVIHLDDVNDNTPQFSRSVYSAFLEENDSQFNSSTHPLLTVSATDNDEANTPNSAFYFTIIDVSDPEMNSTFDINATTGQLFLKKPIDYEKLTSGGEFYITVEATDQGSESRNSSTKVDITVQDKNDNSPIFNETYFTASVYENATSSMTYDEFVAIIAAYDLDGTSINSGLNYYITDGAFGDFRIDSSSGRVTVQKNAVLDRETTPSYNVTIAAVDTGSPPKTSSTTLSVKIKDVNDVYPEFNQSSYSKSVLEEDERPNVVLVTCYATDEDENNHLNYSIEGIEAKDEVGKAVNSSLVQNYFGIHGDNGTVYVKGTMDRETAQVITLHIMVADTNAYDPPYQNATVPLTITLLDINDNHPTFEIPGNMSISENAVDGTILETITATDVDVNRTITYTLAAAGPFKIDPTTGKLTKHGIIDREKNDTIDIVIVATDDGVPPLSTNLTVTVYVIDFNDNAPVFDANVTHPNRNISENAMKTTEVIRMHASDADVGPNSNVTYFIESGDDGKFGISALSGQISVQAKLDRETQPQYILVIVAKDNPEKEAQQKSTRTFVTINLIDVNDNAPQFEHAMYNVSIQENIDVGLSVANVHATDKDDGDNSLISYSITSEGNMFRINAMSGDVHTNASLKNHVGNHVVVIMAADHGMPRLNDTTRLNVTVNDVNLHHPVIVDLPPNNTIKIYECVRLNYLVYKFNFTDGDHGMNAEVRFNISEIQDVVKDTFSMSENGSFNVIKELDVQQKSSYRIYATDRGTPALESEKVTITIEVLDVDDHLPTFLTDTIVMNVEENKANQTVGAVEAIDEDKDSQSCYSILSGPSASNFQINNLTGEIQTTEALDREAVTPPLKITVNVRDCSILRPVGEECDNKTKISEEGYRPNITVNIGVGDINDNPPVFNTKEITVGMRRNTDVDTVLDLNLRIGGNITDADSTSENRVDSWVFENAGDITMSEGLSGKVAAKTGTRDCINGVKQLFCIGRNGSVINNKLHKEDLSGFFMVPVRVWDRAGNDTAQIKIYLISDSQILIMTIFGEKENVAESKNIILEAFGQVTGHTFVYDSIEDHKTSKGEVDTKMTDLYFHVVEPKTQRILTAKEAKSLVDLYYDQLQLAMQQHKVISIVSSTETQTEEDTSTKTIFILVAVIVALAVTLAIIIYVSISTRGKYKRKLKAATVKPVEKEGVVVENGLAIPGSNKYSKQSNPLLNVDIDEQTVQPDNLSLSSNNSLDLNEVDDARHTPPAYDTMEEREMTIDMYTDDGVPCYDDISPLDAALRLHEMQSAAVHTEDSDPVASPEKVHAFLNEAYDGEEYECTEI